MFDPLVFPDSELHVKEGLLETKGPVALRTVVNEFLQPCIGKGSQNAVHGRRIRAHLLFALNPPVVILFNQLDASFLPL